MDVQLGFREAVRRFYESAKCRWSTTRRTQRIQWKEKTKECEKEELEIKLNPVNYI